MTLVIALLGVLAIVMFCAWGERDARIRSKACHASEIQVHLRRAADCERELAWLRDRLESRRRHLAWMKQHFESLLQQYEQQAILLEQYEQQAILHEDRDLVAQLETLRTLGRIGQA